MQDHTAPPAPQRAGFWRRLFAFLIDVFVLGLLGMLLGAFWFEPLAQLGIWGRAVGFAIALVYFGVGNSRITGGQTLGKAILSLRTQGVDGALLSLPRSMARYAVFGVPFFLNNAPFSMETVMSPVGYLLSLLIFGGLLGTLYLFLFNRNTRRVLHDYATRSWVVHHRLSPKAPAVLPKLWRVHVAVVALIALGAFALPAVSMQLVDTENGMFADLFPAQSAVAHTPGVTVAKVTKTWRTNNGEQSQFIQITANISSPQIDDEPFARKVAQAALDAAPRLAEHGPIQVTLVHGFDIGIASSFNAQGFAFTPDG